MALKMTRLLRCGYLSGELKRFYARGSRFFPPPTSRGAAEDSSDDSKSNSNPNQLKELPHVPRLGRESVPELLENSASFDEAPRKQKTRMEDVWNSSPYPKGSNNDKRNQATKAVRPLTNPEYTSIFLFPGQGTQFVGMGKNLLQYSNVKDMYELASTILGFDLLSVCLNGPKPTLDQTSVCQAAILVTSLACLEKLKQEKPEALRTCVSTAGFSVGEITALVFAGSLTFENAVKLIKIRGEAMQLASEITPSGMMTVFFGPDSELGAACNLARKHCQTLNLEIVDCRVANYLYPDCKVIAGNNEALDFIESHAADFKLRRLKRLPVSGAFHTRIMDPAVEAVKKALTKFQISDPTIPVFSNVDGKRYRDSQDVLKLLPKQIVRPVCWEQIMHILYERQPGELYPQTYECGPGSSLKAILKKVNLKAANNCHNIFA